MPARSAAGVWRGVAPVFIIYISRHLDSDQSRQTYTPPPTPRPGTGYHTVPLSVGTYSAAASLPAVTSSGTDHEEDNQYEQGGSAAVSIQVSGGRFSGFSRQHYGHENEK